jgi:hypothetical protein
MIRFRFAFLTAFGHYYDNLKNYSLNQMQDILLISQFSIYCMAKENKEKLDNKNTSYRC